jgi:hypothetical protein
MLESVIGQINLLKYHSNNKQSQSITKRLSIQVSTMNISSKYVQTKKQIKYLQNKI